LGGARKEHEVRVNVAFAFLGHPSSSHPAIENSKCILSFTTVLIAVRAQCSKELLASIKGWLS
jgi:hypothetical protein